MRTTKTLLKLLEKEVRKQKVFYGMCEVISLMVLSISSEEVEILRQYLRDNIPRTKYIKVHSAKFEAPKYYLGYWWRFGERKPRYRWLKRHIKKL